MAHWVSTQGQVNTLKMQKHALIVTSPSDNPKPKRNKKFLTCNSRLAESLEGLNSSLAQTPSKS